MHLFCTITIVVAGLIIGWLDWHYAVCKRRATVKARRATDLNSNPFLETRFGQLVEWVARLSLGVFLIATIGITIAIFLNGIIMGKRDFPLGTPQRALAIQSIWIVIVVGPFFFLSFSIWSWRERRERRLRSVGR